MTQTLAEQMVMNVRRYLDGGVTLDEFQRWFMPASWNIHRVEDTELRAFVGEIGLWLAEYEGRHRTEDDLRTLLATRISAPTAG